MFLNYPYNSEKIISKVVLMKVISQQIHNFYNGNILILWVWKWCPPITISLLKKVTYFIFVMSAALSLEHSFVFYFCRLKKVGLDCSKNIVIKYKQSSYPTWLFGWSKSEKHRNKNKHTLWESKPQPSHIVNFWVFWLGPKPIQVFWLGQLHIMIQVYHSTELPTSRIFFHMPY